MKVRIKTATQMLEDSGLLSPGVSTLGTSLLRPFLDLVEGTAHPINARVALYAGQSLGTEADPDWLPPQSNTRKFLRRALIRESRLPEFDVIWPAELPPERVTAPWAILAQATEDRHSLGAPRRYQLVCALYKLGLFEAAVAVGAMPGPSQSDWDDHVALTRLRVLSAMSKLGRDVDRIVPSTAEVYMAAPAGSRARLAAAVNLCIHFARATRDGDAVALWAARVDEEMRLLALKRRAADHLVISIALRASAFAPFVRHDHKAVARVLGRATEYARLAATTTAVPPILAAENLYAVMETQTNAAVARGDRGEALRWVSEVVSHDPLEPRAWLQYGDVQWDEGHTEEALAAYQSAARLGVPYTSVAWYCIGRCQEALEDMNQARLAYAASVYAEPLALTSLLGIVRTARRTGMGALADWAAMRLLTLHASTGRPGAPGQPTEARHVD